MERHKFTVFVTGDTPRGQRAVTLLRALCDRHLDADYAITVVDVLADPRLAEDYNVVATPTVIRTTPGQPVRALGDLSDSERVAAALGIDTGPAQRAPVRPSRPPGDAGDQSGDRRDDDWDGST